MGQKWNALAEKRSQEVSMKPSLFSETQIIAYLKEADAVTRDHQRTLPFAVAFCSLLTGGVEYIVSTHGVQDVVL